MKDKRMFSRVVVNDDDFLDLPLSTQALYFHLGMDADDDGFLNNIRSLVRLYGANQNDYDLLVAKRYIIEFPSGVRLIRHWKVNNYIRSDRYKPTAYSEALEMVKVQEGKAYELKTQEEIIEEQKIIVQTKIETRIQADAQEVKLPVQDELPDFMDAWEKTYERYPKKGNAVSAHQVWVDKLKFVIEPNRMEIAREIYQAIKLYVADYEKRNPDDENYRFVPKFDKWLKEDCDWWIKEYEKSKK